MHGLRRKVDGTMKCYPQITRKATRLGGDNEHERGRGGRWVEAHRKGAGRKAKLVSLEDSSGTRAQGM